MKTIVRTLLVCLLLISPQMLMAETNFASLSDEENTGQFFSYCACEKLRNVFRWKLALYVLDQSGKKIVNGKELARYDSEECAEAIVQVNACVNGKRP